MKGCVNYLLHVERKYLKWIRATVRYSTERVEVLLHFQRDTKTSSITKMEEIDSMLQAEIQNNFRHRYTVHNQYLRDQKWRSFLVRAKSKEFCHDLYINFSFMVFHTHFHVLNENPTLPFQPTFGRQLSWWFFLELLFTTWLYCAFYILFLLNSCAWTDILLRNCVQFSVCI